MASLGTKFDASAVDTTQRDYENLPNGIYSLEVTASEVKATSAGTGTILKLTYDVVEPEQFKGRKIFGNMNLENPTAQAAEIGKRELASLCRAVGLSDIDDSEQLHFLTFIAKVGLGKGSAGYSAKNEIKRFYFPDEGDAPDIGIDAVQPAPAANDNAPAPRAAAPAPKPAAAPGAKPWAKKAA